MSHKHALRGSIPRSGTNFPCVAQSSRGTTSRTWPVRVQILPQGPLYEPDATADRHPTFNRTLVRLQLPPGSPLILPCRPTVGQRTLNPPMMVRIHLGQPILEDEPDKRAGTVSKTDRAGNGLGSMPSVFRQFRTRVTTACLPACRAGASGGSTRRVRHFSSAWCSRKHGSVLRSGPRCKSLRGDFRTRSHSRPAPDS